MNKNILLIGLMLCLLGTAQATELTGDFSLETDCAVPDTAAYVLYNNSGSTRTYEISAVGQNSEWINLNGEWINRRPLAITLGSGQSEELYAFVKPQSCFIEPGEYTVTLEIKGDGTTTKVIDVRVVESRLLDLEISPQNNKIEQCEKEEFEIELKNNGERNERISLSIEGIPQSWASFSLSEMLLEDGASRTIMLGIEPACDAETKEHEFTVRANIKGSSFFKQKTASITIEDSQAIVITAQNLKACGEKEKTGLVKIKNNGPVEDKLTVSIEGINWAFFETSSITLASGEEETVAITFTETAAENGQHDFYVKTHSTKFNKDTEKEFSVELQDCYNISIESIELNGELVDKTPTTCIENNPVYKFNLTNDGVEEIDTELKVSGLGASVSPAFMTIESGENKKISIELDLSKEQPGEKNFTLTVKGNNFAMQKDYVLVVEDCFNIQVDWDGLIQVIELDANSKSEAYTIVVKNNGSQNQNISVEVDGPKWIYFEPEEAIVEAGEEKEVYLYFAPPYDTKEGKHTGMITVKADKAKVNRKIETVVYGGLYADLGTASVKTDAELDEIVETIDTTLKVSIKLSNDSNSLIRVLGLSTKDINSDFEFSETTLQPEETIEVPVRLYLGQGNEETVFDVILLVETDKGTMERTVSINLEEEPEKEEAINIGLFGLVGLTSGLADLLLAAVVIAVIAIFAAVALRAEAGNTSKESGMKHLVEDVQNIPGKKLEEIGKHKKGNNKNLHDIVKEIKKKHVVKKKPVKKKK